MKNVVVLARAISVLASLTKLAEISGVHARFDRYHRMIEKTYHLGIYYRESGEDTLVLAILDLRRDPKWIREQLHQRPDKKTS